MMIQLVRIEPKLIIVLNTDDTEIRIDRQHYEEWSDNEMYKDGYGIDEFGGEGKYWEFTLQVNDTHFKEYCSRYLSQHKKYNDYTNKIINVD